jgi:hypothetical protein
MPQRGDVAAQQPQYVAAKFRLETAKLAFDLGATAEHLTRATNLQK